MDTPSNSALYGKVHTFSVKLLEGTLVPAEREELEQILLENPAGRRAYIEYIQESACLRWLCVEGTSDAAALASPMRADQESRGRKRKVGVAIASGILACTLAFVIAAARYFDQPETAAVNQFAAKAAAATSGKSAEKNEKSAELPNSPTEIGRSAVATITGLGSARWTAATKQQHLLSRCAIGDRLQLSNGSAELTFDAGAQLTVFAPADFEITSATSVLCRSGRVTALVDERGKGFSIDTPKAKVVDLGTQFGLSVSDDGDTEVVVFQGAVDLSYHSQASAGDASSRRIRQGEALLLKKSGEFERVVSIERNSFIGSPESAGRRPAEPVIADVRDNIRTAQSIKSYQIVHGGLDDDELAFVDRFHQWNGLDASGLPPFLLGADYVMPFNDDKFVGGLELNVRLLRPATLYVFLDNNMDVPKWLKESFKDTGVDIGLDCSVTPWHRDHSLGSGAGRSIDFRFSVWEREIEEAGTITLGGIEPPKDRTQGFNMYGIAAVAKR